MIKLVRMKSDKDPMYEPAMKLYGISFPAHEQRRESSQKEIFSEEDYHFDLVYDGELFVGIILYWEQENYLYVEHFCMEPAMRSHGYGQKALAVLGEKDKLVILEIDPPVEDISLRRKAFYERAGFKSNPYSHVHPPYHKGNQGHALVIMSYPRQLDEEEYNTFYDYLQKKVMGGQVID